MKGELDEEEEINKFKTDFWDKINKFGKQQKESVSINFRFMANVSVYIVGLQHQ
jgi:hypothetical protein